MERGEKERESERGEEEEGRRNTKDPAFTAAAVPSLKDAASFINKNLCCNVVVIACSSVVEKKRVRTETKHERRDGESIPC